MLRNRVVASLLLRKGQVVQSLKFKHTNVIHNKASIAVDFFDRWAIDEIVVLDVTKERENRFLFYEELGKLSEKCLVPLAVGGWVDSIDEIRKLLSLGADKVVINTEGFRRPGFLAEAASVFGSQCIVASIDVRRDEAGGPKVWIDRGTTNTDVDAVDWARKVEQLGVGEIFLTSIDNDGARCGYDVELIHAVTSTVGIPIIAFGGVSEWKHFAEGMQVGGADAVAAANIFHYTENSAKKAKSFLKANGLNVR